MNFRFRGSSIHRAKIEPLCKSYIHRHKTSHTDTHLNNNYFKSNKNCFAHDAHIYIYTPTNIDVITRA